ncbi:ATP-dependent nuclease [Paenibacillus barengoltzii]|uniref:ATP-dependent nuclease n=1 Tax=Paenibacillus barengoltzii TaxID=343517 RepID=UPI0038798A49
MKLAKVKIRNFRSFGDKETTITVSDLTALIGSNSSGKTTFFQALLRLFGDTTKDREITRVDFHIPFDVNPDSVNETDLSIEAVFEFPEVIVENGVERYTIPSFFTNFVAEQGSNQPPYIRIRLESKWIRSNQPEGLIETSTFFVVAPEGTPISNENKKGVTQAQLSLIKMIYVPALRDPSTQLRMVTGTLLWRLIQRINFDNSFKQEISAQMQHVKDSFSRHSGVSRVKEILKEQWQTFHKDKRYSEIDLHFNTQDIDSILKKIDPFFSPSEIGTGYTVDKLGDGLRSLFYFSLVASLLQTEQDTLEEMINDPNKSIDERTFSIIPPCLTIVAVEEPENHVAPHLLGKIIQNLRIIADSNNAQVILSSHNPAIIKRIDPTEIRHFRMCSELKSTISRTILLPEDDDEAFKYVKEAVKAYPEIYFSSLVILGEGDSEEVILPRIMDLISLDINTHEIAIVPLGGRHVNHFWRLLAQLDIPYITLLDFDLERGGGDWGRIKYVIQQLLLNGVDEDKLLTTETGRLTLEDLEKMHTWEKSLDIMLGWIKYLENFHVFFSYPLDIDFMMLESYKEAYIAVLEKGEGPQIRLGQKQYAIQELTTDLKQSAEFDERVFHDVASTLKDAKKKGVNYSDAQKELMIWYKYFFLYRGKPVIHMKMLSQMKDEMLRASLPEVFIHMSRAILSRLNDRGETSE